jgi:chloride channel protein, CIC family
MSAPHYPRTITGVNRALRSTWASLGDTLVRYSVRLAPGETQRTFAVTLLAGAACGVTAVAFHAAILAADQLLIGNAQRAPGSWWIALTLLTPALGGLFAGLALTLFPAARGSGIPQVKAAYAVQTDRIRLRDGIAKFVITSLQIGSGASLGREGPTVHMCAAVASALGRWFALSPRSVRRLLPVGSAAGVAAAFNAPIAAITFTVEEIVGTLDQTVLSGVVVAAALAAVIEHTLLGSHPIFTLSQPAVLGHLSAIPLHAALGVLAGFISVGFTRALLGLRGAFQKSALPLWLKPSIGGLVTGGLAVAGLALVSSRGVAGGGYTQLADALNGQLPLLTLIVLGVLKAGATLFSYASGGAGGLFAPVLFLGAMLGGSVGWLEHQWLGHSEMGAFALVGMGALFAGVIRAPITSVLIIFEMTGGYGLVLPLMIANMTSYVIARRFDARNLYDALLEQDGIHLPGAQGGPGQLEHMKVEQAMSSQVISLPAELTPAEALAHIQGRSYSQFPVVDAEGRCLGLINDARLRRVIAENGRGYTLAELVRLKEYLYPDDPLIRAVVRMNAVGSRQLPVVSRSGQRLLGILAMADIFRIQAQAADGSELVTKTRPALGGMDLAPTPPPHDPEQPRAI